MAATEHQSPRSLADGVYDRLLSEILSAQLRGGSIVQERRLADKLGVSRSPLRDALGRLEGQGLLVRNSSGVLSVRVVTLDDYLKSLDVRMLVEPTAAALACGKLTATEWQTLDQTLELIEADTVPDIEFLWQFDNRLHSTIARRSGNDFIAQTVSEMRRYTTIFERQLSVRNPKPGVADHRAIVNMLGSNAPDQARSAMAQHLDHVRQNVLQNY